MPDRDARLVDHDSLPVEQACEFCGGSDYQKMDYPDGSQGYVCESPECYVDYQNACLEVKGDLEALLLADC